MPDGSATAHVCRPKLATVFCEGYGGFDPFRKDVVAALTVAIVALPLSMAIAVASSVSPERGLYTAIIGGFLVSASGGSRFQVGGAAGASIVLVEVTVGQIWRRRPAAHGFALGIDVDLDRLSRLCELNWQAMH
jgi:sulfate permease, SulP family